jgi:hypothetical protein
VPVPPVGTRGEARVAARGAGEPAAPGPAGSPGPPVHPPWTRSEDPRSPDQPLLVPAYRSAPDSRPATLDGRVFAWGQWSRDEGGSRDSDYLLTRLGVRADATNHLGLAERLRFAGEIFHREVIRADAPDEDDLTGQLDLLSVAFGTEDWAPTGVELGRFLSPHLPEIGLVDGVEFVCRYEGGVRVGAGFGSYPLPFPARATGEDVGAHVFFDYAADPERTFACGIGGQVTWHEGEPDRDLLLLRAEGRPWESVRLYGNAKVDFYSGSDTIKNEPVELTELLASGSWDLRDGGLGATVSHFTWPELKRREYYDLPPELVRDGFVDRVSLRAWARPFDWLRTQVRADVWRDQVRDGTALTLDADFRGPIGEGSALLVSVFHNDGGYTAGPGARVALRGPAGDLAWRVGYRWYDYALEDLVTGPESYTRQSVELGGSLPLGIGGDLDCSLEHWFGDLEDAWSLGLYVQWRF